ncbi:MAG: hypothetical protein ACFFBZ_15375 [Promethearchaeota archaeon]
MFSGFIKRKREKKENDIKKRENYYTEFENSGLLKKNTFIENGEKKIIKVTKNGKIVAKYEEIQKKAEEAKVKTGVIEQDKGIDISLSELESDQTLIVPSNIQEQIEKIILKILYEDKSVKSLKLLTEKVLEKAVKKRITISEKHINLIIYQMNSIEKIEFTQKDGWKIRI